MWLRVSYVDVRSIYANYVTGFARAPVSIAGDEPDDDERLVMIGGRPFKEYFFANIPSWTPHAERAVLWEKGGLWRVLCGSDDPRRFATVSTGHGRSWRRPSATLCESHRSSGRRGGG